MRKLRGWMDKGGHYDVEIKRADGKGKALCCGNERVDAKGGHYGVQIKRVDGLREGIMMCK